MPKSKRAKVVHLTKVDKKGKEFKAALYSSVQECLEKYQHCFVFSVDNMRNTFLKHVRNEFSDSRYSFTPFTPFLPSSLALSKPAFFTLDGKVDICLHETQKYSFFFGKTKVMAKALGSTPETSAQTNTHLLAAHLHGSVGLFFTSRDPQSIISYFEVYSETDYARAGTAATRDFVVPAGTVYSMGGEIPAEEDVAMAPGMEPELRKLGMPTSLVRGKITLQNEYEVCREGQILDSRQTRLLKLFGVATAEFKVQLVA